MEVANQGDGRFIFLVTVAGAASGGLLFVEAAGGAGLVFVEESAMLTVTVPTLVEISAEAFVWIGLGDLGVRSAGGWFVETALAPSGALCFNATSRMTNRARTAVEPTAHLTVRARSCCSRSFLPISSAFSTLRCFLSRLSSSSSMLTRLAFRLTGPAGFGGASRLVL